MSIAAGPADLKYPARFVGTEPNAALDTVPTELVEQPYLKHPVQVVRSGPSASLDVILARLFERQSALGWHDSYLDRHGSARAIRNHVLTCEWYTPYLPAQGTVLDWGCRYAPDSCLLRAQFGDRFTLHACDLGDCNRYYAAFFEYAGLTYTPLNDIVRLPYADQSFDVVIGSGTLEHVAMDYESLKEVYRVLRPDGVLILTYLPHVWSYSEWVLRTVRQQGFHRRLYGMGESRQLLKRAGLYPIASGYHTYLWERVLAAAGIRHHWNRPLARLGYRVFPVQMFCSTLCFVARKVASM